MEDKTTPEGSEISLRVERYEDIFSDFDIRPFSRRSLSVDFLEEVKRAAFDKENDGIEISFHVPANIRNENHENVIRERLKDHFRKHYHLLLEEKNQMLRRGSAMVAMGIFSMLGAAYILFQDPSDNLILSFLVVFLEPAAWFLLWEGMDMILFSPKNLELQLQFYKKMSHPRNGIHFKSY